MPDANPNAEHEFRQHLQREQESDPETYAKYMRHLSDLAAGGFKDLGRGAVVVVDNGSSGFEGYVPAESVDLQFGKEAARLCANYSPESQWIYIGFTDGKSFPVVFDI